jgi:hypothetical protein
MIFGVDSHRSSLSVAGVDELGRVQVAVSFGNRPSEHLKLARLLRRTCHAHYRMTIVRSDVLIPFGAPSSAGCMLGT